MTSHRDDPDPTDAIWRDAADRVLAADLGTEEGQRAVVKAVREARRDARRVRIDRVLHRPRPGDDEPRRDASRPGAG